jgi:hypothetical protein
MRWQLAQRTSHLAISASMRGQDVAFFNNIAMLAVFFASHMIKFKAANISATAIYAGMLG